MMYIQRKRVSSAVKANADVAPGVSELLFEADDVAQLLAEATGEDVTVDTPDGGDTVTFEVGDQSFSVEPEGTEEVLEASTQFSRPARRVAASARRASRPAQPSARRAPATAATAGRAVRRVPARTRT